MEVAGGWPGGPPPSDSILDGDLMTDMHDATVLGVWAAGSRLPQAAAVRALSEDMLECVREYTR